MSVMTETVRLALRERSPNLYRQLQPSGKLQAFVTERANEINELISNLAWSSPEVRKAWSPESNLSITEMAAVLNKHRALATEIVLAEMLEFPQDETSPPSPDETVPSDPTT